MNRLVIAPSAPIIHHFPGSYSINAPSFQARLQRVIIKKKPEVTRKSDDDKVVGKRNGSLEGH